MLVAEADNDDDDEEDAAEDDFPVLRDEELGFGDDLR